MTHLIGKIRKDRINKLVAGLKKQQSAFTRSRDIADGAVRDSNIIAKGGHVTFQTYRGTGTRY